MNTDTQEEILHYIQENGPISSLEISKFMDIDKKEVYSFLTICEKDNIVIRSNGIDDGIIVFHWSLNPDYGILKCPTH